MYLNKYFYLYLGLNDKANGKGRFIHADGDYYEGGIIYIIIIIIYRLVR